MKIYQTMEFQKVRLKTDIQKNSNKYSHTHMHTHAHFTIFMPLCCYDSIMAHSLIKTLKHIEKNSF